MLELGHDVKMVFSIQIWPFFRMSILNFSGYSYSIVYYIYTYFLFCSAAQQE